MTPNIKMIAWMIQSKVNTSGYSFIVADENVPVLTKSSLKGRGKELNYKFIDPVFLEPIRYEYPVSEGGILSGFWIGQFPALKTPMI